MAHRGGQRPWLAQLQSGTSCSAYSPRGPFTRTFRALTSTEIPSGMTSVRLATSCFILALSLGPAR